ncbi:UNVERIFIED_CONTAM: Trehalose-6-P synthase/phosphatase complex synthase subunit [Siphonaria sp. JEL0065]|nr:Trehalose-6-P synthase/phosphatase complex synthase subunit [Siphonaria sp. JEL0065]
MSTTSSTATSPTISKQPRLLLVSNRLPITLKQGHNGEFEYTRSSGGLVSALSGLSKETKYQWFGWPGHSIPQHLQKQVSLDLLTKHSSIPVFLSDQTAQAHYTGFCNSILWPLFHYHPNELSFNKTHWQEYNAANLLFAQSLASHIRPHDVVWIHDFHLMMLPKLLKGLLSDELRETVKVGFFLHTPFPSSEVYRILPVRKVLLQGVLEADCVGFQTYDYCRHFMSSCARILGLHCFPDGIEYEGRKVKVGTYPIGIDPEKFTKAIETTSVQVQISRLRERFKGMKIMVGIDRLDYIKALPQKIHAFSHLLYTHPELQGNVVFIQIAVPSREDVLEYQNLDRVVNGLVGKVNGRFGTVEFVPIHYVHKSVGFDELVSLYAVADVCVVSSTRDGMNLVSYEFIASQQGQHGVLVLSEFAGAAQSLNGAIIVNPWNTEEMAQGMYDALTMAAKQKESNYEKLNRYVQKYTSARWGTTFVNELMALPNSFDGTRLVKLTPELVVDKFLASRKKRVFFIDYDGTLKSNHSLPEFSNPSKKIRELIKRLASLPDTYVYIFSGRSRNYLDAWFGDIGVGLSAEHGCFYRHPPNKFDDSLIDALDSEHAAAPMSPVFSTSPSTSNSLTNLVGLQTQPFSESIASPRPLKSLTSLVTSPIPYSPLMRHISPFRSASYHGGSATTPSPKLGTSIGSASGIIKTPRRMQHGWLSLVDDQSDSSNSSWSQEILPLFQYYTERTPGSFVEEKEINLTWHYRNADPEFGMWQAAELHVNLEQILNHLAVSVILGNKTVEVRPSMVDKASAARSVVHDLNAVGESVDFFACIGDGKTDEVVFQYLNDGFGEDGGVVTCTVGRKQTEARYYLEGVKGVEVFLGEFCGLCETMTRSGGGGGRREREAVGSGVIGLGVAVDVE